MTRRTNRCERRPLALTVLASLVSMAGAAAQQPTTVVFMCPHGAAKSVLASAYFERAARERGLKVRVVSVGTEPDNAVSPLVARHLEKQGYPVPVERPRAVTADDLEAADVVISLGCDVARLPIKAGTLQRWDDVPGPGENLEKADERIREKVDALVAELAARRK